MEIEEAKERLRAIYASYGFDERPVAEGELCFFDSRRDYPIFSVSADEIKEFADVAEALVDVSLGPVETCILAPKLREQWVEALASLIHDARFRVRSGHLLRLAVLRGRPASLAFVSPHSD